MSDVQLSIEGIPLTELIGKEVNVKIISGRTPLRLPHHQSKRCFEILWHIEAVTSTGDYRLRILLMNKRSKKYTGFYRCSYSNVELSQVENGTIFDVNTSKMQEQLSTLILNKI